MLNRLLLRARELDLFRGFKTVEGETYGEVTHLLFADNTFVLCQPEESSLLNLRYVMLYFQVVSSLNINLTQSKMVTLRNRSNTSRLTKTLGCKVVDSPIIYLSMPLVGNYKNMRT